ncbi:glutathione peroxidase [Nocardia coubleae]|uniref:Glutathione peroxidase n=1 Tax=Nocardia coubleae TaxID=356147 RepID=A0A846W0Y6_9NOCA|nr:glutathione peroxidase [Nocardia coubleae]
MVPRGGQQNKNVLQNSRPAGHGFRLAAPVRWRSNPRREESGGAHVSANIRDIAVETLAGEPTTLGELAGDKAVLLVNVASKCGLTPQYSGLVDLQKNYGERGFTVIGVPCNQFMGQEPGSAEEIQEFCSVTYGVDFPLLAKTSVNGDDRHPLYQVLTETPDAEGAAGDVQWNFEKFLIARDGAVAARFRPRTTPDDPEVVRAVEAQL